MPKFFSAHRRSVSQFLRVFLALFLIAAGPGGLIAAPQDDNNIDESRQSELFSQIDQMLASLADIMGFSLRHPIERAVLTREQINQLVEKRIREEVKPEAMRLDELFMKKFGFVDDKFDLVSQLTDVLTEQATALYDFKTRTMYMATWTPKDMQEFALVHELAHALADQHFDLAKFVKHSGGSDEDVARTSVLEGQASWAMTEYVLRPSGRSMVDTPMMATAAAAASRVEAREYPVYSNAPLYVRESLLFPYTDGLLFQQAVIQKYGRDGFALLFRKPPISTQQILHPEAYFEGRVPAKPALPKVERLRGFKKVGEGQVGELDHQVLVKQYLGEERADKLTPGWRGGRYELLENKAKDHAVLVYASEWESEDRAAEFFKAYGEICEKKWKSAKTATSNESEISGTSESGKFVIRQSGKIVTSVEGLPES